MLSLLWMISQCSLSVSIDCGFSNKFLSFVLKKKAFICHHYYQGREDFMQMRNVNVSQQTVKKGR